MKPTIQEILYSAKALLRELEQTDKDGVDYYGQEEAKRIRSIISRYEKEKLHIEFGGTIGILPPKTRRQLQELAKIDYESIPSKIIHVYGEPQFIEEDGTPRYTMTREYLERLYKEVDDFIADCTYEESKENLESTKKFLSLLHKHINHDSRV
jgi:hypothetical protein